MHYLALPLQHVEAGENRSFSPEKLEEEEGAGDIGEALHSLDAQKIIFHLLFGHAD